jgi:cation-transporting P-type ATPase 13A2
MVINIGFYTIKGSLVRSIVYPKATKFRFDVDSYKYLAMMALVCLGLALFDIFYIIRLKYPDTPGFDIFILCIEIFLTAIPPALPLALQIGI